MSVHDVVIYGAPPFDNWNPQPTPMPFVPGFVPGIASNRIVVPAAAVPAIQPTVAAGLAQLLPLLKAKLAADKHSLTVDEATALVWLEGVAAGVQK